jgi:hypothetical protein
MKKSFILLLFCLFGFLYIKPSFSQTVAKNKTPENKLIQYSGMIVSADSLYPVPYTSILIRGTKHGTISDYYGFFSFVAQENDVIEFIALGFKPASFIIPDSLEDNKYSMIQVMNPDTYLLKEALILPWPTKEQFKQAFLKLELPNDDAARAQRNIGSIRNPEYYGYSGSTVAMNQQLMLQQQNSRVYGMGQIPINNLMNPFAWAQFISDWRSGKLKKQ